MKKDEIVHFIQLLKTLDKNKQKELYFMLKGAVLSCNYKQQ